MKISRLQTLEGFWQDSALRRGRLCEIASPTPILTGSANQMAPNWIIL
ncbi:MAG: hypothetical protein LBU32_12790 [Clostridiales bacterium]|nr:hypothetical protein [Clostridiales bacterium]